ncbi:MAG TPA: FAD-dependent oxidoreductase [Actinospica sp.]|nr:FAD-dependent oxidoreductase [Actinospica sp.]
MAPASIVIIGAGLAGAKAAEELRDQGFEGRITLIGDEHELPYERPPLSKGYLLGKEGREKMFVHPHEWYADQNIDLLLGVGVSEIDRSRQTVARADGHTVAYDALLLATGSTPRQLPVPGADLDGVVSLRHLADCERIKSLFKTASRVVFVGGGWIGLEVAAAAREAGVAATILEADTLPLVRVLGPEIARVFADLHVEHGVDLRTEAQVTEIVGDGRCAAGVRLADGAHIDADAVIVAVGAAPNTELAVECGLDVDNGVLVDAALRTSDPNIYAAGDIANAMHPTLGKRIRVEHWDNARKQPKAAARAMLGQEVADDRVPYFFTDQYDLGMEFAGYLEPGSYNEVIVRGDLTQRKFVSFWLAEGRVRAGMNVNIWDVNAQIQKLVKSGHRIDPALLADPDTPLDELVD